MKLYKDSYSEAVFEFCNFLSNKDFNFISNVYINSKNRVILRYKGVVLWNMVETLWLKVLEKLVKDPI